MLILPFFPLATVIMSGICIFASEINCTIFECTDIVKDSLDCDVCWCYEEGGFGCCHCCTVCHDADDADDADYDDSCESFHKHVYAKKS